MPPAYPGMPLHSPPVTALSALGVLALVLVAALALVLVGSFNGLVRLRTRVDAAWAQIDVQLQRRHDLIPNLVEAVKGYAAHERVVLEEVTAARSTAVGAQGVDARGQAEQQVSGALRSLLAVAEAYPDLEADRSFLALQEELEGTEGKIAYARQFYNDTVQRYDTRIQSFPGNVVAGLGHFEPRPYFQADQASRGTVAVQF